MYNKADKTKASLLLLLLSLTKYMVKVTVNHFRNGRKKNKSAINGIINLDLYRHTSHQKLSLLNCSLLGVHALNY